MAEPLQYSKFIDGLISFIKKKLKLGKNQDKFELDFKGGKINTSRYSIGTQIIFRIVFSDKRPPLVITRAEHSNVYKFWTSIPEGRQIEAEEVGILISEYFKNFQ